MDDEQFKKMLSRLADATDQSSPDSLAEGIKRQIPENLQTSNTWTKMLKFLTSSIVVVLIQIVIVPIRIVTELIKVLAELFRITTSLRIVKLAAAAVVIAAAILSVKFLSNPDLASDTYSSCKLLTKHYLTATGKTLKTIVEPQTKSHRYSILSKKELKKRQRLSQPRQAPQKHVAADNLTRQEQDEMEIIEDAARWGAELKATVVETKAPADYSQYNKMKISSINEQAIVQGLRSFAEIADGRYPTTLSMPSVMTEVRQFHKRKYSLETGQRHRGGADPEGLTSKLKKLCETCARLAGSGVTYYGDKVTAAGRTAVLMHWRVSYDQYRVVFGDLRVETANAQRLIELQARMLKSTAK